MSSAKPLRGAFIGFGNVAANGHLPGWLARSDVEIVAASDATPGRREVFLAACPKARWYTAADELLAAGGIDFVDICTPPGSHAGLIGRALAAGLHVLCEKPLVTRVEDALALAAARRSKVLHTVHNWLEAPISRKVSELVASGALGTITRIDWQTLRIQPAVTVAVKGAENWRVDPAMAGGGILFDHGWHALYCVLRWAGKAPKGAAAKLETRKFREWPLEDTATVDLDFGDCRGRVFLTWAADERANKLEIKGSRGRLHIEGADVVLTKASGEQRFACPPALSEGSHHPDWFDGVARDFLAAIATGGEGNLPAALLCARLIDLAQRSSAADGKILPL
ncbi:MAG TPA: Gfo/Idh/MocA family oxidoreductase [Dongiaceae bacterium]